MPLNLLQVIGFVVELTGLPHFPDDAQPTIGQAAVGVVLGVTASQAVAEIGGSPFGGGD